MREYLDKATGLWKWGHNGVPKFRTKEAAKEEGLIILAERLRQIRDRIVSVK